MTPRPAARRQTGGKGSPPPQAVDRQARPGPGRAVAGAPFVRALAWGTVVAFVTGVLAGLLRLWVWILALEPLAMGVVIGEAAAAPSSVRRRRPPRWSYGYVFVLACTAYFLVHFTFWLASDGFVPSSSFLEFLRVAPSSTAAPFFQSVDMARYISLATGGATVLKYWLWVVEGLLMGLATVLAYRGGSVRRLKI